MGKNNNIIEINGKRYDAVSGRQLHHAATGQPARRSIDGVVGPVKKSVASHTIAPVKTPAAKPATKTVHRPAKPHARAPQPAKTLMRNSVSKPKDGFKKHVKAQGPAALAKQPAAKLAPKPSVARLDEQRLKHAKHIPQSQLISRFGAPVNSGPAVLAAPQPAVTPLPVIPAAQPVSRTARVAAPKKQPRTTADILQTALEHANSHNQPAVHPHKRRASRVKQITGVSIAALSLLFIVGLFGIQNVNSIKLRVASSKAGFSAALPAYRPAGYSLSKLNYGSGVVTIHFHSNSDNRTYDVTERTSNWDSAGLRDSFVAPQSSKYQTEEAAGRTIYLYGDGNATWVSNNIWYQVTGVGSLDNQQLVDLATSL
ncbi:MAG TPA: hypothetical protein VF401_04015 [Candidatus Saccharimonadales bacterium]